MRILVTGGGGSIGRRIVELLHARGDTAIVLARRPLDWVAPLGAFGRLGDIRDAEAVGAAMRGVDAVCHTAGMLGAWGDPAAFHAVNLDGTRTVLAAARRHGVPKLVFTSTPSVVGYARDIHNGGPELPHAARHQSAYAASKAAAERLVLAANCAHLATVALRPHLVIGPRDPHTLPRIVQRAAQRRLALVGTGRNLIDLTYVDNAAWAHLDAIAALERPAPACAGRAYFISDGQPVVLAEWLNTLLRALGLPPVERRIPPWLAEAAAIALETAWRSLALRGEPPATRFTVNGMRRAHWFDPAPAARDLGYRPRVAPAEAMRRCVDWLREQMPAEGGAGVSARAEPPPAPAPRRPAAG